MADTDAILRPAIEAAIQAERENPDDPDDFTATNPNVVLTAYVVLAELKGFGDDGEGVSQTFILPHPDASLVTQLGLVQESYIKYQAEVLERYRR